MKKVFLLLFLLSIYVLPAQIILIKDSALNTPIENVNLIFEKFGVTSDKNGAVDISEFKSDAIIKISHVSYRSKKLKKTTLDSIVFLTRYSNILPTIILSDEIKLSLSEKHNAFTLNPVGFNLLQTSISGLLSNTSPVLIQESQSGGGSPNYRGMEANRLLLVVDNVSLNNAIYRSGHLQSSSSINPFFIESIKLLSGPASVSYGNGAMGGALLFNTKKPKNKNAFYFNQQFESSSNGVNINFLANYYKNKISSLTGFSLNTSGNLTMGKNRFHGYVDWGAESVITNENEQLYTNYSKGDFIHKTKYSINQNNFIVFNTQYSRSSKIYRFDKMNDIKDGEAKYKEWYYGPQIRFLQKVNYTAKYKTIAFDKTKIIVAFQNLKESRHKQLISDLFLNNRLEDVKVYDFSLDLNKKLNNLNFSYGFGGKIQNINSSANLRNNTSFLYNTTRYPDGGSFVQDFFCFSQAGIKINKTIDFLLGLRLNNSILNAKFNNSNLVFKNIENNNTSIIKSGNLYYTPISNFTINTSYYGGFRNPNVDDIGKVFSKDGVNVVVPNQNLEPEYADNFEIGFIYNFSSLNLNLQLFHSTISNAISREYGMLNGQDSILYDGELMRIQMNKNIEKATLYGFNFSLEYNILNNLLVISNCNYLHGDKSNERPLSHIPPFNAKISIEYNVKTHSFNFYTKYSAWKKAINYDDLGIDNLDEATLDGNPSWYTLNIGYSKKIDKNINVSILIENLLDLHYKTFASGISASGRNFIINLNTTF